ncbi:MAG: hypothetical protein HKN99_01180 [Winogradskyella sp.]|nr:hypothetical protein [Winogradskyella sp.]
MKKIVIMAIALISLNAMAQPNDSQRQRGNHQKQDRAMMNMSPEEMATVKSKKMTLHLDLTEKQQSEVKALILKQAEKRQKQMDNRPKNDDGTFKKPTKEELVSMRNQKLDEQIEMKQSLKSILTKEQYEQFNKEIGQRDGKRRNKQRQHRDQRRN